MKRLIQRRLIIPRGDTGTFSVPVLSTLNTGDVAIFTIFDDMLKRKVFEKKIENINDTIDVRFEHEDTVNLPVGKFYWDIKFYKNPVFIDDELVDGEKVDSYYAAFTLPVCEIRQTGDKLITADGSPTTTLNPETIHYVNAAISDIQEDRNAVEAATAGITEAAEAANTSAMNAAAAKEDAIAAANQSAANRDEARGYASNAYSSSLNAQESANRILNLNAAAVTLASNSNATASYNSQTGVLTIGVPRGRSIQSVVLNQDYTLTLTYDSGLSDTIGPIRGEKGEDYILTAQDKADIAALVNFPVTSVANKTGNVILNGNDVEYSVVASYDNNTIGKVLQLTQENIFSLQQDVDGLGGDNIHLDSTDVESATIKDAVDAIPVESGSAAGAVQTKSFEVNGSIMTQIASGQGSFASGYNSISSNIGTHTEGAFTLANTVCAHAEGMMTASIWTATHTEGAYTMASGRQAHAEGYGYVYSGRFTGEENTTIYSVSDLNLDFIHVGNIVMTFPNDKIGIIRSIDRINNTITLHQSFGKELNNAEVHIFTTYAYAERSHCEGSGTITLGSAAHAEGAGSIAKTYNSHAEGSEGAALGNVSHAEGTYTVAAGHYSHTENNHTFALGRNAHAENNGESLSLKISGEENATTYTYSGSGDPDVGDYIRAYENYAKITSVDTTNKQFTVNNTLVHYFNQEGVWVYKSGAFGDNSHVEGKGTTAMGETQHVQGKYNILDNNNTYEERPAGSLTLGADTQAETTLTASKLGEVINYDTIIAPRETDLTAASQAYAIGDVFMVNGKLCVATAAITLGGTINIGTNCEYTSVAAKFVKNTDIASANNYGVVKVKPGGGTNIDSTDKTIILHPASLSYIKAANATYMPITPIHQHESTFYGLAKAAGDTTQSQSNNTVGNYTESAKDAIKNMLDVKEPCVTPITTESAVIASIDDGADNVAMESVIATIEPVQNLNGYSSPWPAGGGVNKWDEEWESGIWNTQGVKEAQVNCIRSKNYIPVTSENTYYIYFDNTIYISGLVVRELDDNYNFIKTDVCTIPTNLTVGNTTKYIVFCSFGVDNITTYNNDIAINYPSTKTTYSPYANVCNISGWTGSNVYHANENLFDVNVTTSTPSNTTNSNTAKRIFTPNTRINGAASTNYYSTSSFTSCSISNNVVTINVKNGYGVGFAFKAKPNTQYYFSCNADSEYGRVGFASYASDGTFTSIHQGMYISSLPYTVTTPNDIDILLVVLSVSSGNYDIDTSFSNIQLYEGLPSTIAVDWTTTAGTVYKGYIDVAKGQLVATYGALILTGTENDITWAKYSTNSIYARGNSNLMIGCDTSYYDKIFGYCNVDATNSSEILAHIVRPSESSRSIQFNNIKEFWGFEDNEPERMPVFLQKLNQDGTPFTVIYRLVEPIIYNLTPIQIKSFLGKNNLWANTGNISITYSADTKLYIEKQGYIKDVQLNGSSIITNSIANVPMASYNSPGVVTVGSGLFINGANKIITDVASASIIKTGTDAFRPISTVRLPEAVFYGLTKAAGVDMASSNNAVGTYTDAAKVAIQKMLGVYEAPWELIREDTFTNAEEADHTVQLDSQGNSFELTDVIVLFETPTQETYAAKGGYGQIHFYYDANNAYRSESGAWTQEINGSAHGIMALYEQKDGLLFLSFTSNTTSSNRTQINYRYGAGFGNSGTQTLIMPDTYPRNIIKIVIPKVTGTGHYKIYGKRKWTT